MGHAVLASDSTILIRGDEEPDDNHRTDIEDHVWDHIDEDALPDTPKHVGYAKVDEDGVKIALFSQYQNESK